MDTTGTTIPLMVGLRRFTANWFPSTFLPAFHVPRSVKRFVTSAAVCQKKKAMTGGTAASTIGSNTVEPKVRI